ncbi:GH116 family glycosyl hydrolase [Pseudanabaena sp. FACHB-2040]|uniref:GH116 family glycosyl hydrolase n=1 Tax=Pseudanabaena sp. FACHB-2040 TaxID=2692859 RepID=UPI0016829A3A|nr:GH116 family glycosyl hydrolase [Pseudanabaena sp. FACHB-2040]MBD2260039.1 bile acid beta-glucosidase [Pseudanabaena sp. FACHB-2040]
MTENTSSQIPPYTWQRPIGLGWEHPYIVRYASNLDDGPWHGAPLGGFGAGCIGRSPRGDFNLWHLDGGEHTFQTFPACQFSVFEQTADGQTQAHALCTEPPQDDSLSTWQWYPGSSGGAGEQGGRGAGGQMGTTGTTPPTHSPLTGTYHALYPRSWFVYENVFRAKLTCEQFSPIWAHNYQEASYPVAVFEWTAQNPTDQPLTISILLSWQNMVGWFTNTEKSAEIKQRDDGSPYYDYVPAITQSAGNFNSRVQAGDFIGCLMDGAWSESGADPGEGDGQFCIATVASAGVDISYHTCWNPVGDGAEIWQQFSQSGELGNVADEHPAAEGEQVGCAIALRFTLQPGETRQVPFVLAWDLPVTEFAAGVAAYRRYTDFFGTSGGNAWDIARDALRHYQSWQQQIVAWQQPILDRADLPDWLKMALFNELYDLTSGGTLWSAATEADPVGQFGVLECIDYRWYESLDVRLYGGFATLMLWPELEKAILRAFARAIPTADARQRIIGYYYTIGADDTMAARKLRGATPHDLGAPNEHPWVKTNYTSYQDCNQWKDLPSDFVIQVYRAFKLTGETDFEFLAECWPSVVEALKYLKLFDKDSDGIPENGGAPDQTFDDWRLKGISAYCGGLWLAALESAIAIGETLTAQNLAPGTVPILLTQYRRWLESGLNTYHRKLWNGRFYQLDTGSGSAVVMADQLCGQFCAQQLGLPDLVSPDCTRSALEAIYDACFVKFNQYAQTQVKPQNQKFAGAQVGTFSAATLGLPIGAANGVLPDGSPEDPDSTHQLEIWTGINFGLATFLAQQGMTKEALEITEAVVRQIYGYGLQFRTPEALTALGTYRACHYLRPLAIWGLLLEL